MKRLQKIDSAMGWVPLVVAWPVGHWSRTAAIIIVSIAIGWMLRSIAAKLAGQWRAR